MAAEYRGPAGRHSVPARAGDAVAAIETPALLLDLDAVDRNLAAVHGLAHRHGVRVRPHAKAHKCPELGRLQLRAGAQGVCCQKLSEAEVFAAEGFTDILLTNEIVGAVKAARAARLAGEITLSVCVDHARQVEALGAAAAAQATRLGVLVEVDVGQGRCGVRSPEEALSLVRLIAGHAPHLGFEGLHAFNGKAQHERAPKSRESLVALAAATVRSVSATLAIEGYACETVTGGGTGTLRFDLVSGAYTEVQPGSYVLMDADYASNEWSAEEPSLSGALTGLCTVVSRHEKRAVLDGGLKAFATDRGAPRVMLPGWAVTSMSDEHTVIAPQRDDAAGLEIGDILRLQPGHCDPTVNLHDWLVATRGDHVEAVWPIAARGAML